MTPAAVAHFGPQQVTGPAQAEGCDSGLCPHETTPGSDDWGLSHQLLSGGQLWHSLGL